MREHFTDRLLAACETKGAPLCVGLDPVFERLPAKLREAGDGPEACGRFCAQVLEAVAEHVPCVKPQLACFERYGARGWAAYERVVLTARSLGVLVIADGKRGDIGTSAAHYAAAFLSGPRAADALTVNPYLGPDGLEPFVDLAAREGRGLFALARTSNPGGDALQGLKLSDGRTVVQAVARMIADVGEKEEALIGRRGYSVLGAVVGATRPADAAMLRGIMPRQLFLVPGLGAQGGTARDVRAAFHQDGAGAIVTASRSVIYAYEHQERSEDWSGAVADAARQLRGQVAEVLGRPAPSVSR